MASTSNADTAAGAGAAYDREFVSTLSVPTKVASTDGASKKVIDTRNLSEQDLEALKKQDPFLYYSIPRPVRQRSGSAADMISQRNQESARSCRQRASCPSLIESSPATVVERRSCISVECDIDLILEDFMGDAELFGNEEKVDLDTEVSFDVDQLVFLDKCQQQFCITSLYESS